MLNPVWAQYTPKVKAFRRILALMWFSLSAAQNHKDAIENRDKAVLFMTSAQIAEAERLARNWKPTRLPN